MQEIEKWKKTEREKENIYKKYLDQCRERNDRFTSIIEQITLEVRRVYHFLSPEVISVYIKTQINIEVPKSYKLLYANGISIIIKLKNGVWHNYKELSTGQKVAVILSFIFSLRIVLISFRQFID